MTAPPITGIEPVDRELQRRGRFPSADAAEAMAAKLLAVWRALQPGSSMRNDDILAAFGRSRHKQSARCNQPERRQ